MVRAPAIRGRPAPQKKSKSTASINQGFSVGGQDKVVGSGSSNLPQRSTAITKSLKRAKKRAELLSRTSSSIPGYSKQKDGSNQMISKSALRRRKRKAKDELAKDLDQGRQGGVNDLMEAMEELDEEIQLGDSEEDEGIDDQQYVSGPLSANTVTKGGRVTTNHRKRVLQQEQARQKAILSNPAFQSSPFAALREHVKNSMMSNPTKTQMR